MQTVVDDWHSLSNFLDQRQLSAALINDIAQTEQTCSVTLYEALGKRQLASKLWLLTTLEDLLLTDEALVAICGGWYGVLAALVHADPTLRGRSPNITSIDIDPACLSVANQLNSRARNAGLFEAVTQDMYDVDYADFSVVINTSCEHIPDLAAWLHRIPAGMRLILQSNNFFQCSEHVNCVHDADEFRSQVETDMVVDSLGSLVMPEYTRYMISGTSK